MSRLPLANRLVLGLTAAAVGVVMLLVALPELEPGADATWVRVSRESVQPAGARRTAGQPDLDGQWRISATARSGLALHHRYVQEIDGRPVLGTWAAEHQLDDGRIRTEARLTRRRPGPVPETRSATDVFVARAVEVVGSASLRTEAEVRRVWWPDPDGETLLAAVEVRLPSQVPLGDFRVVLDEATDRVLGVEDVLSRAKGLVFETTPKVACGHAMLATDEELLDFATEVTLDHLDGSGYLEGRHVRVTRSNGPRAVATRGSYRFAPSEPGFLEATCYHTVTRFLDRVVALGVRGYEGPAFEVDATGHTGDRSYFSPLTARVVMGTGGIPDGQDPEIILHELGHALHHRAQPDYWQTDASRTVSEGVADYLACTFFDDPFLAEWDAAAYSNACPPYLRRLDRKRSYPGDLVGEVHADGEILASALWAMRGELGPDLSDRIVLESLFFLRPDSDLRHAARTILTVAELLEPGLDLTPAVEVMAKRGLIAPSGDPAVATPVYARAFPSPFRTRTTFQYVLTEAGPVAITVHDVRGARIRTLVEEAHTAGSHAVAWDGRDDGGRDVPPGMYFYRITTASTRLRGKIVRLD